MVQIGLPPASLAAKISISAHVCPFDAGGIASGSDTPFSQKTHGSSMTPDGQHVASSAWTILQSSSLAENCSALSLTSAASEGRGSSYPRAPSASEA